MKKTILLLISFQLVAISFLFAQTIRRCNNNPGVMGVNIYTTIQAAHDAAAAGDIIYVEPTTTNYGSLTMTKQLTIIGNGYTPSNPVTVVPIDSRSSAIADIVFNNGSQNSLLTGIYVNSNGVGNIKINVPNITITRCKIQGGIVFGMTVSGTPQTTYYGNSALITKCILAGGANLDIPANASGPGFYCSFLNNISGGLGGFINSTFTNNSIFGQLTNLTTCTVTNNIIALSCCTAVTGNGNAIANNIGTFGTTLPASNGNVNDATLSTIFINSAANNLGYVDSDYRLSASSPAKEIGSGGIDAGAFGGANPYVLSGLPSYPIITNFTTSGVGNNNAPLNVSITVRGNN
ncbi:MAG: hypothetical protein U0X91_13465 [Spirosomataceae bacterium]